MGKKPTFQDNSQRPPAEAARLARDVMKRMLATSPTPHEEMTKKPKKKSKSRRK